MNRESRVANCELKRKKQQNGITGIKRFQGFTSGARCHAHAPLARSTGGMSMQTPGQPDANYCINVFVFRIHVFVRMPCRKNMLLANDNNARSMAPVLAKFTRSQTPQHPARLDVYTPNASTNNALGGTRNQTPMSD